MPATVIAAACRATAGQPPAASDPRTAALAERADDGLSGDTDYNNTVFDVVGAISALADGAAPGQPEVPGAPALEDWQWVHTAGQIFIAGDDLLRSLRMLADLWQDAPASPGAHFSGLLDAAARRWERAIAACRTEAASVPDGSAGGPHDVR